MDYNETYEKFWKNSSATNFGQYERNLVLSDFFPVVTGDVKIADIAGGTGIVSEWLEKRGYKSYLVEFSNTAVEIAKRRGLQRIYQQLIDSEHCLPFEDKYFDYIFFGDIIEHLFDAESVLKEIKRVLKKDGMLILSCPNMAYWRFRTYYLLDGDFRRIDVAKQDPWEQEHIRFYNIKLLKEFLGQKLGFEFVKFQGVNNIWHSRFLARHFPNLFAHTIVASFKK